MKIRHIILSTILLASTIWSQAQQVNPVPDYVFRNQMSVGRNAVTDTAAYFSIGPRYGANKGFMPPIVGDTATFSSGKRNGLLIFSVQKNKFLYWDSVRVQWSDMAGSSGSYIVAGDTASMLSKYLRKADTTAMLSPYYRSASATAALALKVNIADTATMLGNYIRNAGDGLIKSSQSIRADTSILATKNLLKDQIDSLGLVKVSGTGNTNYVTKFTSSGFSVGNSLIYDNGSDVGIGTNSPQAFGSARVLDLIGGTTTLGGVFRTATSNASVAGVLSSDEDGVKVQSTTASPLILGTGAMNRVHIFNNGNVSINDDFDEGYKLNVYGTQRTTGATTLASSSGNVAIGNVTASEKMDIDGRIRVRTIDSTTSAINVLYADVNGVVKKSALPSTSIDTNSISTRAWRQKGIDSVAALVGSGTIGGSGTTNYVPKFTGASTIGNSQIFDNGTQIGLNTTSPAGRLHAFGTSGATTIIAEGGTNNTAYGRFEMRGRPSAANQSTGYIVAASTEGGQAATNIGTIDFAMSGASGNAHYMAFSTHNGTSLGERLRIFANGRVFVGASPSDAGYQFDINGTLRSVNGANFATTSGNVGIGTASPSVKLDVSQASTGSVVRFQGDAALLRYLEFKSIDAGAFTGAGWDRNVNSASGFHTWSTAGTERMRIDANGNVGIGTASPAAGFKLDVRGRTQITGADGYLLDVQSSASNGTKLQFYIDNSEASLVSAGTVAQPIKFYLSGEKYRFNTDGELWVNTQTDAGDYKLQVSGNIYNTGSAVLAATGGSVGVGTASPVTKLHVSGAGSTSARIQATGASGSALIDFIPATQTNPWYLYVNESRNMIFQDFSSERGRINSAGEWIIDASGTDAGDYKLQVVGNARIGTGKLDIASNTTFGLGVARSGTSEVAGQIYNSNGILYFGAESSAGGQIFTGSSAYAAVIGSGANYPLQFATNNVTRATINTDGELLINTTTDAGDYKLQVSGKAIFSTTITTGNGVGLTAKPWLLGSVVATNVQLDTSNYVEVEINGTFYRLAIVTPL